MLTGLEFLAPGKPFPPDSEVKRMQMYSSNRALFEGEHADVYEETLKRIQRVIGNFDELISYPVVLNFQKLVTLKTCDLLFGEPPIISAGDRIKQAVVERLIRNCDLFNTAYQVGIDVSRYGDGLFYLRQKDGKGIIDITQPPLWYPIVSEDDTREVVYHVLAWVVKENVLKVQVHSKGSYEAREYRIEGSTLGGEVGERRVFRTGLDDFAVIQVPNTITSGRTTGIDDYTDIDSIISDLMVRIGQIDRILDKHANPSMSGPQSALEKDPRTGEWRLKTGNFFPRDSREDPEVNYITWDGQLAANFSQVERLLNLLYSVSEMGSAIFGDMVTTQGAIPSGSALRRLMLSPLAKVTRIRSRFDFAIKKALVLCSQLGGEGISELGYDDISISWQDGLPPDFVEDSAILQSRTANKATMSQYRALVEFDKMTPEQAEEEMERILTEEAASSPITFGPGHMNEGTDEVEEPELEGEGVE